MTTIPYDKDIKLVNQKIYNFVKSKNTTKKNVNYIKNIFKSISKWNIGYIL